MFEIDGKNKKKVYLYSNVLIGWFWVFCFVGLLGFFGVIFKLSGFYTVTMVLNKNQNQTQILLSFLFVTA